MPMSRTCAPQERVAEPAQMPIEGCVGWKDKRDDLYRFVNDEVGRSL